MPRNLSEKTLELHIHAELYHESRTQGMTPIMIGFTQAEEIALGADSQVRWGVSSTDQAVIFQFKKAKAWQRKFTFYINNNSQCNQHAALINFGTTERLPAYYVLPLIGTEEDLIRCSPGLIDNTVLVSPGEIGPLDPPDQPHRLVIQSEQARQATIYSEPRHVKLMSLASLVSGIRTRDFGVSIAQLHELLAPNSQFRIDLRQGWWETQLPNFQLRWKKNADQHSLDLIPRDYRRLFRSAWGNEANAVLRQAFKARRDTAEYQRAVLRIKDVPIEQVLLRPLRFALFKIG